MATAGLEHVNITVTDPDRTARMLDEIFGWKIRWQGDAIHGGRTIHVGSETDYIAVYSKGADPEVPTESYATRGGLNHIGITVDDLDRVEQRVLDAGFTPHQHGDYEPGRRFYFGDADGIEWEVISYAG